MGVSLVCMFVVPPAATETTCGRSGLEMIGVV